MEDSVRNTISEIAQNAVREIERISQLVSSSVPSSNSRSSGGENQISTSGTSARSTAPSNRQIPSTSGNALSELRRRFPTFSSSSNPGPAPRARNMHGRRANPIGRPSKEYAIRDIVIVGAGVNKTPLGRADKLRLEEKGRVISGFSIYKTWNEKTLYDKVKSQFPEDCKWLDFEFVKNCSGTLVTPRLASGAKIDANILLKSIASTAAVYARLYVDDFDDHDDESQFDTSPFGDMQGVERVTELGSNSNSAVGQERAEPATSGIEQHAIDLTGEEDYLGEVNGITEEVLKECELNSNPTEILKYLQGKVLIGRQLDITDPTTDVTGETNFILVDRGNLLESSFDELSNLVNFRLPLEVNFIGEAAQDYGGPRKEFFRLVLIEIKEKYFDGGMQQNLSEHYTKCGIVMGLSVLQNGKIPQFLPEEMLNELVYAQTPSPCILNLREGLKKVGVYQVMVKLPLFLHLFRPSPASAMTVKKLAHLLAPNFGEEGTNARKHQKDVYSAFIRYFREVASGRRKNGSLTITLGHILQFVCGTDEEPVLGFARGPEICFCEYHESFMPTANTCINVLNLPHPTATINLPCDEVLFNLYDYAFGNIYFGII